MILICVICENLWLILLREATQQPISLFPHSPVPLFPQFPLFPHSPVRRRYGRL